MDRDMTRRYDVDWGTQRLTLAETGSCGRKHDGHKLVGRRPHATGSGVHRNRRPRLVVLRRCGGRLVRPAAHTTDVPAAGGLLTDENGRLLCIHRIGHWDLPKGKLEAGEALEEAAAREVEEECGVPLPEVRPFRHDLPRLWPG